jgi:hypothetical protein
MFWTMQFSLVGFNKLDATNTSSGDVQFAKASAPRLPWNAINPQTDEVACRLSHSCPSRQKHALAHARLFSMVTKQRGCPEVDGITAKEDPPQ